MRLYLPKQYDIKQLYNNAKATIPDFSKAAFYKIFYLIQDANFRSYYMGYPPAVHSKKFKKIKPLYSAYLTFLEDENVIRRNDYFSVCKQSYLYQFTFDYLKTPLYSHIIEGNEMPLIGSDIYNLCNNEILIDKEIIEKFKLYLYYLKFNAIGANDLKEELYQHRLQHPDMDYASWQWVQQNNGKYEYANLPRKLNAVEQYNFEQATIDRLTDRQYYCQTDDTGWRVHTPLTILPHEYKKFVTFRGNRLFSIDLRCSQVFLTLVLMNPDFWNPNSTTVNVATLKMDHLFETAQMKKKIVSALNELSGDYETFKRECCNGNIYDYMQSLYKTDLKLDLRRDDVKVQFYLTMFTANNFFGTKQAEPKRLFAKLFPTVYNVFKAIKTQRKKEKVYLNPCDTTPVKKFSKLLPIMLQRLESHIFIQNIAAKIVREHAHIPIFTVHDSISTTQEFVDDVEKIVLSEINRVTGLTPTLKTTCW